MKRLQTMLAVLCVLAWSATAAGETKIFKVDQFPADLAAAASAVGTTSLSTQPGFAQGEAFGQLYRPDPSEYPIKILGVQMILAAPPNALTSKAPAMIEIWLSDLDTADPGKDTPDFSISTADLFNPATSTLGMPLQGNMGYSAEFDWSQADGHPPMVTKGTIRVVVRYTAAAQDLQADWGTLNCSQEVDLGMCGCQKVGILVDQTATPKSNLIHLIWPPGHCSGTKAWKFMEDVGITGDVILRLSAQTAGGCDGDCTDKQCGDDGCGTPCGECTDGLKCVLNQCVEDTCTRLCKDGSGAVVRECGDDGCDGTCGSCADGQTCVDFRCLDPLALTSVSPTSGYSDVPTPVTVTGTGFATGLEARIAALRLTGVVVDSDTQFHGSVPNLLDPGIYDLSVSIPDGQTATLTAAFEVRTRPDDRVAEAATDVPTVADEGAPEALADAPLLDVDTGGKAGGSGGGCAAGGAGGGSLPWILVAMALVAIRGRRWA